MVPDVYVADTSLPCTVRASPNHGDRRGRSVDALVLHYTGMASAAGALDRLCDPAAEVSSHYIIDEDGGIFQLVPEKRRAWHAGRSFWKGERDLNSVSIGIEIANAGHDGGLPDFPDPQIEAVIALCRDIIGRHDISHARVLAHSDIAPGRKIDPGPKFPWARLARAGIGHWPSADDTVGDLVLALGAYGEAVAALRGKLSTLGFDLAASSEFDAACRTAVSAFRLRYRPGEAECMADAATLHVLADLLRK